MTVGKFLVYGQCIGWSPLFKGQKFVESLCTLTAQSANTPTTTVSPFSQFSVQKCSGMILLILLFQ